MKYKIIYLNQFNTSAVYQVSSTDNTFKYDSTDSKRTYTLDENGRRKIVSDHSKPMSASQRALMAAFLTGASNMMERRARY